MKNFNFQMLKHTGEWASAPIPMSLASESYNTFNIQSLDRRSARGFTDGVGSK
jgi:hypothetical protein